MTQAGKTKTEHLGVQMGEHLGGFGQVAGVGRMELLQVRWSSVHGLKGKDRNYVYI